MRAARAERGPNRGPGGWTGRLSVDRRPRPVVTDILLQVPCRRGRRLFVCRRLEGPAYWYDRHGDGTDDDGTALVARTSLSPASVAASCLPTASRQTVSIAVV